jgi:hypothetical protein
MLSKGPIWGHLRLPEGHTIRTVAGLCAWPGRTSSPYVEGGPPAAHGDGRARGGYPGIHSGWWVSGERVAARLLGLKPPILEFRMQMLDIVRPR